ncbi:MAG: hypothetical protein HYU99_07385 [Deltaproteobacteria bacterium]|nr:hypothetical protein [Deltaproteobacteria bacterium]
MKKLLLSLLGIAIFCFAVKAMAFDIPTGGSSEAAKVKEVATEVAKKGIEKGLNDKLSKENCAFSSDSSVEPSEIQCKSGSLDSVIKYVNDWHNGLEGTISSDFNLTVKVSGTDKTVASRQNKLQTKIDGKMNYWDNIVRQSGDSDNMVKLSVSVK